jgi:hypothetical protein
MYSLLKDIYFEYKCIALLVTIELSQLNECKADFDI